jgi:hypothetical protein
LHKLSNVPPLLSYQQHRSLKWAVIEYAFMVEGCSPYESAGISLSATGINKVKEIMKFIS